MKKAKNLSEMRSLLVFSMILVPEAMSIYEWSPKVIFNICEIMKWLTSKEKGKCLAVHLWIVHYVFIMFGQLMNVYYYYFSTDKAITNLNVRQLPFSTQRLYPLKWKHRKPFPEHWKERKNRKRWTHRPKVDRSVYAIVMWTF